MRDTRSLQAKSYDYLLGRIKEGGLVPGQIYSLNKMAKEAGLSRTPFRDAVIKLEQERYIDVIPSKGFMLHEMTLEDFTETCQFREALELYCLKQLSEHLETERGQQYFHKLEKKVELQREILESDQPSAEKFGQMDYEFHRSMIQYVGNESMLEIYRRFMYRIYWINVNSFKKEGRMQDTYEEHTKILKMVQTHDIAGLEQLLNHHLSIAKQINEELLA